MLVTHFIGYQKMTNFIRATIKGFAVLMLAMVMLMLGGCAVSTPDTTADFSNTQGLAEEAYRKKDYIRATQLYKNLTDLAPTEGQYWFRLGNSYARLNNIDLALAAYREVLIRNPEDARAWYNSGILQLEQAASTFAEAMETLPDDDLLAEVSLELSRELLVLVDRANKKVQTQPDKKTQPVSPAAVEVIVMNKAESSAVLGQIDMSSSYSDQDRGGAYESDDDLLKMTGNSWRKVVVDYMVTQDTLLSFEFRFTREGEIHAIGFDEDNVYDNHIRMFQLAGRQKWISSEEGENGSGAWQDYKYSGTGQWIRFSIPVGKYYKGRMKYLVFANDDDENFGAIGEFRQISLSEAGNAPQVTD